MENLLEYLDLLPILIVGTISGLVAYMRAEPDDKDTPKEVIKIFAISIFLALITYSILTATSLPYLARVGIAAGVGGLGIDTFLEIAQKILSFRSNKKD